MIVYLLQLASWNGMAKLSALALPARSVGMTWPVVM